MSLTVEDLIEKSIEHRKRKKFEEALVSAIAATELDPENASAWWQLALNRISLNDNRNGVFGLRKTLEFAPDFSQGWAKLGTILKKEGEASESIECYETALSLDDENLEALEALSLIYGTENNRDNDIETMSILARIERIDSLSSYQLGVYGLLHYYNKNYLEAINYWKRKVILANTAETNFNLGLAYSNAEVSQDADAVDAWRQFNSDYEPSEKALNALLPKMLELAKNARNNGETILPSDEWYRFYMNPYELLNPSDDLEFEDFNPKLIQRLKKILLQEIDLEDGNLPWMQGVKVDKSRAIGLCEQLNDENAKKFHWSVFINNSLRAFLSKGSHEHFLVDENKSPIRTIQELTKDSDYSQWLSGIFFKQFDLVLTHTIKSQNLYILECLLDGRRWVLPSDEDRCFEGARRLIDNLLIPLRKANESADEMKPSESVMIHLIENNSLLQVFNLLPKYFEDLQHDALTQIRGVAISCFNSHSDAELSKSILQLTKRFHFKSTSLNSQLNIDFEKINELINEEKENEAKLTQGNVTWEITKEGVRQGSQFIAVKNITALRYGALISNTDYGKEYDYLFAFKGEGGRTILFSWKATTNIEKSTEHFQKLVRATRVYVTPAVIEMVIERLRDGFSVNIGECKVISDGVKFETKGWFSKDSHFIPWSRVNVSIENGDVTVQDSQNKKTKISFPFRETENSSLLELLVNINN